MKDDHRHKVSRESHVPDMGNAPGDLCRMLLVTRLRSSREPLRALRDEANKAPFLQEWRMDLSANVPKAVRSLPTPFACERFASLSPEKELLRDTGGGWVEGGAGASEGSGEGDLQLAGDDDARGESGATVPDKQEALPQKACDTLQPATLVSLQTRPRAHLRPASAACVARADSRLEAVVEGAETEEETEDDSLAGEARGKRRAGKERCGAGLARPATAPLSRAPDSYGEVEWSSQERLREQHTGADLSGAGKAAGDVRASGMTGGDLSMTRRATRQSSAR